MTSDNKTTPTPAQDADLFADTPIFEVPPINTDPQKAAFDEVSTSPQPDLQAQLDAALAQNAVLQDLALRSKAEAENARRRAEVEKANAHKYALENFAESLLPVKDTLELGLANTTQTEAALREGVEATLKLLAGAFEKHKLLEINPAAGTKFDPTYHNGISMMPSEHPAQTVVLVMQKGYQVADRVLRPALVAVSSGS